MRRDDANRGPRSDALSHYTSQERRASPRIETPFPAVVRSVDIDDLPFEEHTVLDNLSGGGLYLRLTRQVQPGIQLFVLFQLSIDRDLNSTIAGIALHGVALRVELRPGGIFGTAISLAHHRFISREFLPEWLNPWTRLVGQTPGSGHALREAGD
jgi:hypothetical protein